MIGLSNNPGSESIAVPQSMRTPHIRFAYALHRTPIDEVEGEELVRNEGRWWFKERKIVGYYSHPAGKFSPGRGE
jgi:hypothetical protein